MNQLKLNAPWSLLLHIYVQKIVFYLIAFLNQRTLSLQQELQKEKAVSMMHREKLIAKTEMVYYICIQQLPKTKYCWITFSHLGVCVKF